MVTNTDDNVYIKIVGTVSTESILSAVAPKVSIPADDLILLDSKFIPVTNDKGQFTMTNGFCNHIILVHCRHGLLENSKQSSICSKTQRV